MLLLHFLRQDEKAKFLFRKKFQTNFKLIEHSFFHLSLESDMSWGRFQVLPIQEEEGTTGPGVAQSSLADLMSTSMDGIDEIPPDTPDPAGLAEQEDSAVDVDIVAEPEDFTSVAVEAEEAPADEPPVEQPPEEECVDVEIRAEPEDYTSVDVTAEEDAPAESSELYQTADEQSVDVAVVDEQAAPEEIIVETTLEQPSPDDIAQTDLGTNAADQTLPEPSTVRFAYANQMFIRYRFVSFSCFIQSIFPFSFLL